MRVDVDSVLTRLDRHEAECVGVGGYGGVSLGGGDSLVSASDPALSDALGALQRKITDQGTVACDRAPKWDECVTS